ncbi:hypothetical protein SUDANB19_00153 [Streptomyces sp. enrichment culture]|uniref:hypothetical protein n=1 Tax=Streptomyces albus TaxID=1888 RepID=UPI003F4CAEC3
MPQPRQQQSPPGVTPKMTPGPDHGEASYRGCGRLSGKVAVITGGDSGIGRAVAIAYAGQPAELAAVYVLLATDEAGYVSGARIAVTGGQPIL